MALRHAVLAALLDEELSGYQLAKAFGLGVANFWPAVPQQLYAELPKLEREGLVTGRKVVQDGRPDKRVYAVTDLGLAELRRFTATATRPSMVRDDLLVKVQAADHVDTAALTAQLAERIAFARTRIETFEGLLRSMRGTSTEEEYLRHGERIGPYLTCLRGLAFERGNLEWYERTAAVLSERPAPAAPVPDADGTAPPAPADDANPRTPDPAP